MSFILSVTLKSVTLVRLQRDGGNTGISFVVKPVADLVTICSFAHFQSTVFKSVGELRKNVKIKSVNENSEYKIFSPPLLKIHGS